MSRRLRTSVPVARPLLQPSLVEPERVQKRQAQAKAKQKYYHDQVSKELKPLLPGQPVRIKVPNQPTWKPATVVAHHERPRSYVVDTGQYQLCRNRAHIRTAPPTYLETRQNHPRPPPCERPVPVPEPDPVRRPDPVRPATPVRRPDPLQPTTPPPPPEVPAAVIPARPTATPPRPRRQQHYESKTLTAAKVTGSGRVSKGKRVLDL